MFYSYTRVCLFDCWIMLSVQIINNLQVINCQCQRLILTNYYIKRRMLWIFRCHCSLLVA